MSLILLEKEKIKTHTCQQKKFSFTEKKKLEQKLVTNYHHLSAVTVSNKMVQHLSDLIINLGLQAKKFR